MISVPSNEPNKGAISFVQKASSDPVLAATQIAKTSREQVIARGELEVAQARLEKAVSALQASEIVYFEAVAKGGDVSVAKSAYNNAQAGVRDAKALIASADAKFSLADDALAGLHALSKGEVVKREFSDKKREALADKGKAMPDGSYPIETKADLANAIQSYGRASDPKAVKAHIISRAKELGATSDLPEDWKIKKFAKATEGITMKFTKEEGMVEADLYMCPVCFGACPSTCPCCGGQNDGLVSEERWEMFPPAEEDFAKSFSTSSLLTREFEKSVGFQTYITKGGENSGRYPRGSKGNPDKGGKANRHTGKLVRTREKDAEGNIVRVGWKKQIKKYEEGFKSTFAAGRTAMREADKLRSEAKDTKSNETFAKAAAKYDEASKLLMIAQGNAHGIAGRLREFGEKTPANETLADSWQEKAADARNMGYGAKHLASECRAKAGIA